MKIEEGFRPYRKKRDAGKMADEEELAGAARPQTPAFTPDQLNILRRLDGELEAIFADLETDPAKARGFIGELQQILDDLDALPHPDTDRGLSERLEQDLQRAVNAAQNGKLAQTQAALRESIKSAHALLLNLSRH